ncbi:PEGA domain-containing protein [Chondromyces apiculatus]|uniref:PEGA domain-containing protein n=1 Tax=Chondromyces apiculatus TaxID=51 RepID=UPI001E2BDC08|nr:PEGA domain-containing protein [Chondromyces apiculatus]
MRACLLLVLSLAATPARAEAPVDPRAQAADFFTAGARAYDAGQYAVAAEAFLKAHALLPSPSFLFSAAQAHRRQYLADATPEHLQRAIALYREYLRADPQAKRREDAMEALQALVPLEGRLAGGALASAGEGAPAEADTSGLVEIPVPRGDGAAPRAGGGPAPITSRRGGTRLLLTALPDGAEIALDGGAFSPAPLVVGVQPGPHAVRVRANGYHEEQLTVRAVPEELLPRHVVLRPKAARLRVRGSTGAHVAIDGQVRGTVPTSAPLEVEPGAHLVTISLAGHEPLSKRITLGRDEAAEITAELPLTAQRVAAWTVLAAGGAGVAVSGVLAGLALGRDAEAVTLRDQRETGVLLPEDRDRYNQAVRARNDLALAAAITGGVAGLTLATGAALFVLDHPEAAPPPAERPRTPREPAPRVEFTVSASSLRLRVEF